MSLTLSLHQTRVLGCLIEKEITTPEQYPLSLNALTNACNQKSNREPVLSLAESDVQNALDELASMHLIMEDTASGSRVVKYKHRFCNTEFGELKLTAQELGILCVLFLRGPQTPGELRSRTNRLCNFRDVSEVESVLLQLSRREDGPFVQSLPREPGKRESRWQHLLGDSQAEQLAAPEPVMTSPSASGVEERVAELESQVELMQLEIDELKEQLKALVD